MTNLLTNQTTFSKILPLILALLLIFIIPMLMRRYGLEPEDLIRLLTGRLRKGEYAPPKKDGEKKDRREPYQSNSRSGDLKSLVSTLLIFARRNRLGLVYPGTVTRGSKTANLLALLVTKSEVIGFDCFGYGGVVSEKKNGSWNQHMNGNDQTIPNPLTACKEQYTLVRALMDENGMRQVPLRIAAVFTARGMELVTAHPEEVFDTPGLIAHLRESVAAEDEEIDPGEISRKLNEHVVRIRKSSGKNK